MLFPAETNPKSKGIYVITCMMNGKCYVGSSVALGNRFKEHRSQLRNGWHHGVRLQRAWNKYGESEFLFEVLETVETKGELVEREQLFIDVLGAYGPRGYNSTPTAGSMLGFRHSEATKAKKSSERKGKKLPASAQAASAAYWTGRTHSPETMAKMLAAKVGYMPPRHVAEAARAANMGHNRKHSDATKDKIRQKAMGRTTSDANRAAVSAANKGVKWTPERTAKRIATFHANRAAAQTETGI